MYYCINSNLSANKLGRGTTYVNPLSASVGYAAAVAPSTYKIFKNGLCVFERGENLLQNGMLHFALKLSQSSEIVLQS